MNQNTKIIITGVLGFIGSHTAKAFKKAGYYVIGVDNKTSNLNLKNYVDELVLDDFVNIVSLLTQKHNVDAIIHIAGTSLVGPSIKNPGLYYDNNVAKTNQMLHQLSLNNWKGKIIFSSSAAVYGNNFNFLIKETFNGSPVSPYGQSKKICEQLIEDHSKAHGFKSIALRYFNAAGCDNDKELGNVWNDTHLIPVIIRNLLKNTEFTINGNDFDTNDGTCIRDYLHVSDIANAHVISVKLCDSFCEGEFRSYNLGTGKGYSNLEILKTIEEVTNQKIKYLFGSRRDGDPSKLIADPDKFIKDTSWYPSNSSLKNIIETTYFWMKELKTLK